MSVTIDRPGTLDVAQATRTPAPVRPRDVVREVVAVEAQRTLRSRVLWVAAALAVALQALQSSSHLMPLDEYSLLLAGAFLPLSAAALAHGWLTTTRAGRDEVDVVLRSTPTPRQVEVVGLLAGVAIGLVGVGAAAVTAALAYGAVVRDLGWSPELYPSLLAVVVPMGAAVAGAAAGTLSTRRPALVLTMVVVLGTELAIATGTLQPAGNEAVWLTSLLPTTTDVAFGPGPVSLFPHGAHLLWVVALVLAVAVVTVVRLAPSARGVIAAVGAAAVAVAAGTVVTRPPSLHEVVDNARTRVEALGAEVPCDRVAVIEICAPEREEANRARAHAIVASLAGSLPPGLLPEGHRVVVGDGGASYLDEVRAWYGSQAGYGLGHDGAAPPGVPHDVAAILWGHAGSEIGYVADPEATRVALWPGGRTAETRRVGLALDLLGRGLDLPVWRAFEHTWTAGDLDWVAHVEGRGTPLQAPVVVDGWPSAGTYTAAGLGRDPHDLVAIDWVPVEVGSVTRHLEGCLNHGLAAEAIGIWLVGRSDADLARVIEQVATEHDEPGVARAWRLQTDGRWSVRGLRLGAAMLALPDAEVAAVVLDDLPAWLAPDRRDADLAAALGLHAHVTDPVGGGLAPEGAPEVLPPGYGGDERPCRPDLTATDAG